MEWDRFGKLSINPAPPGVFRQPRPPGGGSDRTPPYDLGNQKWYGKKWNGAGSASPSSTLKPSFKYVGWPMTSQGAKIGQNLTFFENPL